MCWVFDMRYCSLLLPIMTLLALCPSIPAFLLFRYYFFFMLFSVTVRGQTKRSLPVGWRWRGAETGGQDVNEAESGASPLTPILLGHE